MLIELKPGISVDFTFETNKRADYWACTTHPLYITAYGTTQEEAEQRAHMAISLWVEAFSSTSVLLVALDNRDIAVVTN